MLWYHRFSDLGQIELSVHGRQEGSTGVLDQYVDIRVLAVENPVSTRFERLHRLELLSVD
jgi:hypothetical protein